MNEIFPGTVIINGPEGSGLLWCKLWYNLTFIHRKNIFGQSSILWNEWDDEYSNNTYEEMGTNCEHLFMYQVDKF